MTSIVDALRTGRVFVTDVIPYLAQMALSTGLPATSTVDDAGLDVVRARSRRTLERLGVELEVLRAETVPSGTGVVFMWNQETHLDHFALSAALPRSFFCLYNNEVARTPFYGAYLRRTGHIHVDRNDESQWRPAISRAAERVRGGECVLISPEGTRSADGNLLPMKRGAFQLALEAQCPIVCSTVIGGRARLPRGSKIVRPGPLRIVFADAIRASDDVERMKEDVVRTFEETRAKYRLSSD